MWRCLPHRSLHSSGRVRKKEGLLGFLAQTLTKVETRKSAPQPQISIRDDDDDDQFDMDDDELRVLIPIRPVELRECENSELRGDVERLLQTKMRADRETYAKVLRDCGKHQALLEGKRVHAHICMGGFDPDTYLSNRLIQMYGSCGSVHEARHVFDSMVHRTVHSWNIMITAYAHNGYLLEASELFRRVEAPSVVTWNAMVSAYAQNGYLDQARELFERTPERNVVSWNCMIAAYAHAGHFLEAMYAFKRMDIEGVEPNRVSFLHALNSCSDISEGVVVHSSILESGGLIDVAVATGLIIMYGKCNHPDASDAVFKAMQRLDFVVWTALLVAYAQNQQTVAAKNVFDRMPQRTVVTWTAMVAAYSQNDQCNLAWETFKLMDQEGVRPNKISLITALDTCSTSISLENGRVLHGHVVSEGLESDVPVCNALVTMYGRCGDIGAARSTFMGMPRRNVVSWSAMVAAYVHNGYHHAALQVFREMQVDGGSKPNGVTLLSVLNACCNAGAYLRGVDYFLTVPADYGIPLSAEHYGVVGDMLAQERLEIS